MLWFIDCLKDGLHNITENLNNPTYYWNGCNSGTLNSLSEVLKHVESEQTFQEDQSTSAPNDTNITGNLLERICRKFKDLKLGHNCFKIDDFGHCFFCSSSIYGFWLSLLVSPNFCYGLYKRHHNYGAVMKWLSRWRYPPHVLMFQLSYA
jgi:hypothetical protein